EPILVTTTVDAGGVGSTNCPADACGRFCFVEFTQSQQRICGRVPGSDDEDMAAGEHMALAIPAWAATAVGWSSPEEIDAYGLSAALGLAGRRAWHELVTTANSIPNGL